MQLYECDLKTFENTSIKNKVPRINIFWVHATAFPCYFGEKEIALILLQTLRS